MKRMVFPTIESVAEYLAKELKKIRIEVVDISFYPCTDTGGEKYQGGVVSGYIPGKAFLSTVVFYFHPPSALTDNEPDCNFVFNIDGQLGEKGKRQYEKDCRKFLNPFPKASRRTVGSSGYDPRSGCFRINTEASSEVSSRYLTSIQDRVKRGILFYKDFLENYSKFLKEKFTYSIWLWFVLELSDDYQKVKNEIGAHRRFNAKTVAKFPKGFFAPDQEP